MAVDLSRLSVLAQKATEHTHAAHPQDGGGHAGVAGSSALAGAGVAARTLSGGHLAHAEARGAGVWLADDEAVLGELADVLARVCVCDLVCLVGVEPDLALAALEHGGGQALLRREVGHKENNPKSGYYPNPNPSLRSHVARTLTLTLLTAPYQPGNERKHPAAPSAQGLCRSDSRRLHWLICR